MTPIQLKSIGAPSRFFDQHYRYIISAHYSPFVFKYSTVDISMFIQQWLANDPN